MLYAKAIIGGIAGSLLAVVLVASVAVVASVANGGGMLRVLLTHVLAVSVVGFAIGFGLTIRRARTRTARGY